MHEAWAERDSAAALESALKSGNEAIKGALAGWTKAAPADAWAWVDRPETKASFRIGELDAFYRTVLDTLGRRNDESTAASLLDTLPASAMRMTMAGQLAETWAVKAPGELIQWLQRNETKDKDATGFAAHFLGLELARKGAEAVQDVIGTQSDVIANRVLGAAVSRWVKEGRNDQLDALLRSLPGVTVQRADIIYAQVGSGTAPKDPSGGLALLLNIQDPAARNRWLSNTAASLVQTAPSNAMDYVLAISDTTTRETRAKRVYSPWAAKDP